MPHIDADAVQALALGSQLLSGDGEGPETPVSAWLRSVLSQNGPVELIDVADLNNGATCLLVALVGPPKLLETKPPIGDEFVRAVRAAEARLDTAVSAIAALDAVSVNALAPVLAAAQLELPVVDIDGMGRVLPPLEAAVWAVAGLPAAPVVLAMQDDVITLECTENHRIESLTGPMVSALGGWAASALYPTKAADLSKYCIHGSLSRALEVGQTVADVTQEQFRLGQLGQESRLYT